MATVVEKSKEFAQDRTDGGGGRERGRGEREGEWDRSLVIAINFIKVNRGRCSKYTSEGEIAALSTNYRLPLKVINAGIIRYDAFCPSLDSVDFQLAVITYSFNRAGNCFSNKLSEKTLSFQTL